MYEALVRWGKKSLFIGILALIVTEGCSCGTTNSPDTTPSDNSSSNTTPAQHYSLSVSIIPSGSGAVAVVPPGGAVVPGTEVTLIATALKEYRFDHWGGDTSDTSNTIAVIMDSNKEILAYFASTTTAPAYAPTISAAAAKAVLDADPNAVFVDLRPKADYDKEHIPGAISIPFDELERRYSGIPVGRPVIIYSQCACDDQGTRAVQLLLDKGYSTIAEIQGGLDKWLEAGYETVSGQ